MRELIERAIDHALTLAFGLFALVLFIAIHLFEVVGVYEDNLPLRYTELVVGGVIVLWSVYRFIKMVKYYLTKGIHV